MSKITNFIGKDIDKSKPARNIMFNLATLRVLMQINKSLILMSAKKHQKALSVIIQH